MNRFIVAGLLIVAGCAPSWAGGHHHEKKSCPPQIIQGPAGPVGPQGEMGPEGSSGSSGSTGARGTDGAPGKDSDSPGIRIGLGGGLRHQEKWFDVDAVAYQDVKNGGTTVLGLVLFKPGKSYQERENEKLKAQLAALVGEVNLVKQEARNAKTLALALPAKDASVKEITLRGSR